MNIGEAVIQTNRIAEELDKVLKRGDILTIKQWIEAVDVIELQIEELHKLTKFRKHGMVSTTSTNNSTGNGSGS